ncbi:MFS transporter [Actinomadura barringtoniae]|uniref:MFS transporter n=1 Tax=Actinomadura barringtoniae TaxID=1427535 RepID=A0A939T218_9ACTN|nr:MFS transporter [Actinomadura barringtoniae]MBO2448746.1 MFS transporter [Actinomadura barringtoniae]
MTDSTVTSSAHARSADRQSAQTPLLALLVIVMAQLMVVLDATIVTTALPRIQQALDFSGTGLQWAVTGYSITFGGLMLLGGRAGDLLGRKRVFIAGLLLFSVASLVGGLAQTSETLIATRAVQGAGAAMIAPTALALISTTFAPGPQLNRAMGVYAAASGSGAAVGVLVGGLLTTYASWRWVMFVNVPIGLITALLAPRVLPETPRNRGRFDLPGAVTGTLGVAALVYGLTSAATDQNGVNHWGDTRVLVSLVAAAALLAAFVVVELRSAQPLLPIRILLHCTRGGTYLALLCLVTGASGVFFFMTLFLQNVLGYTPIQSGLAFLPYAVLTVGVSEVVSRIVGRTGPRVLMLAGGVLTFIGTLWYAQIDESSTYVNGILGPMVLTAVGFGVIFVPMTLTGTSDVDPEDAGVAASLLNTSQQIGIAIGLATLGSVVWSVVANSVRNQVAAAGAAAPTKAMTDHALTVGFQRGFIVAAGITVLAIVSILALVRSPSANAGEDGSTQGSCPGFHLPGHHRARQGTES